MALPNHLDYMCISWVRALWGQWLLMWAQMEVGAESLSSRGVRVPVGRAWMKRPLKHPDDASKRITRQKPATSSLCLSKFSAIPLFSVHWLNPIIVQTMVLKTFFIYVLFPWLWISVHTFMLPMSFAAKMCLLQWRSTRGWDLSKPPSKMT